ncbi:Pre-mRNA-splicing factor SPF27 [Bisporella sp. PMI_857]|nr:Pre-mRNA-splicing factor SPF27 [Bisporella sp. PMI_857]
MSSTTAIESLPYIDSEPTALERSAAQSLIDAELSLAQPSEPLTHPSLPDLPPQNPSPYMQAELSRISRGEKLQAIDAKRYEELDPPAEKKKRKKGRGKAKAGADEEGEEGEEEEWRSVLRKAYTNLTYLRGRETNLHLLDEFGKNGWLISNSVLEDELRAIESELKQRKEEIDRVVVERQGAQQNVAGEMRGLQEGWKRGVGKVLEVEVAAEGVRREVLERRREGVR